VIGSGPAGIHAAVQAAKLRKKVAIIEKTPNALGGAWIHLGTLPSKTLREVLASVHNIRFHVGQNWVRRIVSDLSVPKLLARAREVANQEEQLVRKHLSSNNIQIITGIAQLEDQQTLRVALPEGSSKLIHAVKILIATGSKPRRPSSIPFDGWRIVDSDEILALEQMPKSLVIYGAGVIGCEYACIFSALGIETTIVDERRDILQMLDREVAHELQLSMEDVGVKFKMGFGLKDVQVSGPRVVAKIGDETIESDVFFFAAGRVSTTSRLGLDKLGIKTNDRGAILVNANFQTNVSNIYAAGDAIGPPALAATSADQGRYASCHAFGISTQKFPEIFPIGIYTIPELSSVGKTEEELVAEKAEFVVGRASFEEIARGYIRGDNHGLLKLLVCVKTQRILGIHVVGADACNLIHIGLGMMHSNSPIQDLVSKMIFNYPTLAEAYRVAAFNALNKIFKDGQWYNESQPSTKKPQSAA